MSAQFSKGDRVEVIASADEGIGAGFPVGATGTVHSLHLFPNDGLVFVCIDGDCEMYAWFMPANLRKVEPAAEPEDKDDLYVEPEPLRKGDAVLVWVTVDGRVDSDGDVRLKPAFFGEVDPTMEHFYSRSDAIVRPDAGQVPPWVKPAQTNDIEAIAEVLRSEGDMEYLASLSTAASLYRAGVRMPEGGAS